MKARFGAPQNIAPPLLDAHKLAFPYTVTHEGAEFEYPQVTNHRIIVEATRSLTTPWRCSNDELTKVLFAFALKRLPELVGTGPLPAEDYVRLHTGNTEHTRPFDPAKVPDPDGHTLEIHAEPPKRIGF